MARVASITSTSFIVLGRFLPSSNLRLSPTILCLLHLRLLSTEWFMSSHEFTLNNLDIRLINWICFRLAKSAYRFSLHEPFMRQNQWNGFLAWNNA